MGRFAQLFSKVASAALDQLGRSDPQRSRPPVGPGARSARRPRTAPHSAPSEAPGHHSGTGQGNGWTVSPGQSGPDATDDAAPSLNAAAAFSYAPDPDGDPDPGEVVWTWVPFEEHDGRGKDRPVLIVARTPGDDLLGVMLTSKDHNDTDYLPVGSGGWDSEGRNSWAKLDRVLLVHPGGMRREGTALARDEFDQVTARLAQRWEH